LTEFDSDGDSTLSIAEFETLHSAMIRETMVDKFQHLDADGDGAVTAEEMTAPAEMMDRMEKMRAKMGMMQGQQEGDGTMKTDN
jgi:Ca2+-binding EF-hand superfamily protein